jgi:protein SCO1/2
MMRQFIVLAAILCPTGLACLPRDATAQEEGSHDHHHDHSAHQRMMEQRTYARSVHAYDVPAVTLLDQDGREVPLASLLGSPEPVALNFIFTTCPTICPVMTATLAHMHRALGTDRNGLRTVSISIDPDYDTPAVLKTYAAHHDAGSEWQFLTGRADRIIEVQKAFDAYTGSKVNHRPLTLLKGSGSKTWVRIDGLAGGAELADEYRRLEAK